MISTSYRLLNEIPSSNRIEFMSAPQVQVLYEPARLYQVLIYLVVALGRTRRRMQMLHDLRIPRAQINCQIGSSELLIVHQFSKTLVECQVTR